MSELVFVSQHVFFGYIHGVSEPPAKITNQVHREDIHQIFARSSSWSVTMVRSLEVSHVEHRITLHKTIYYNIV